MRLFRTLSILSAFAAFLAGCASPAIPPDKLARIKTIGLVSAIDGKVTRYSQALIAFGNETTTGDVSAWKLNDLVRSIVTQSLGTRFNVVPLDVDLAAMTEPVGYFERLGGSVQNIYAKRLKAALKPGQPTVDAYLILTTADIGGIPENYAIGSGLTVFSNPGGMDVVVPLTIEVLDGKSLEPTSFDFPHSPSIGRLPDELRKDRWDEYTPEERETLHQLFVRTLSDRIKAGMKDLQLSSG